VNDLLGKRAPDAAPAMSWSNEDSRKPWSVLRPSVHLMVNKHSRAKQLCARRSDKRDGKLGPA